MKKILVALVAVLVPSSVFAATPGVIVTAYKPGYVCNVPPDHGIYGEKNGQTAIVGCIPKDDWELDQKRALERFGKPQTVYAAGTVFRNKEGFIVDYCPRWYFMGCIFVEEYIN